MHKHYLYIQDRWRNGSAFASRAKGYPFKSGVVQNLIIQPMIAHLGVEKHFAAESDVERSSPTE